MMEFLKDFFFKIKLLVVTYTNNFVNVISNFLNFYITKKNIFFKSELVNSIRYFYNKKFKKYYLLLFIIALCFVSNDFYSVLCDFFYFVENFNPFYYYYLIKSNLSLNNIFLLISSIFDFFTFIFDFLYFIDIFYPITEQSYKNNIFWSIFPIFNIHYIFYIFWSYKFYIIDFFFLNIILFFNFLNSNMYNLIELNFFILSNAWYENIKDVTIYELNHKIIQYITPFVSFNQSYLFLSYFFSTLKFNILNLELPLFFFCYLLFIFTTVSSLFLLSFFGFYGVFILNLISIILFWISSIFYFDNFFIDNISYHINLGKWFVLNLNYNVFFNLYIDSISFSFMFLTLTIAVFVYIYAYSYFRYEPNVERLILLINCFVISMICLVISGNFFVLFLGWELIGLTSFFLINFWSTRMSTLKSAFKAFVFNKISDVSLFSVVLLVYFCFNEVNILVFNNQISYYNTFFFHILDYKFSFIEIVSFFFILCAFIKSAQFGFHIWLPDSMEAPVPASALIHSATLVSAGIFLLLRFTHLFEYSIYSYYIVPLIGSFTAFFGGLSSSYQSDIKRILAYSTISHCGFLMVCYSTYIVEYTILYLYIHGFFKAAVFLCVGNVIRFSRNCQDFRRMGGFYKYLPFECIASFLCLINLSGLPFTIGFYIKHLLLIGIYLDNIFLYFIVVNILGGAIFGLIYSYRLFYYVFFDFKKSKKIIYNQSNRSILKSYFYSNTSKASNIAIFGLMCVSYIISLYLFNLFLNKSSLGEGLDIYSLNSAQYEEFSHPLITLYNNISYFNWILIIIIFIILTASWRFIYNYFIIYNYIYMFFIFILFFYIFYFIV